MNSSGPLLFLSILLTTAADVGAVAAPTFTVQIDWYPTIEHASLYHAQAFGDFAKEGVNVEMPRWKLGVNVAEEVANGRVDIGIDDAVNFLRSVDHGSDLVAVYAYLQETPLCMVSLRHKLNRIEDLAGKKVATVKGYEYLVEYFRLKFPQLKDKVQFEVVDDNVGALERGDVDVGIFFETAQVPLFRLRGFKPSVLRYQDIGYDVYSHVVFVRRDFYERNRVALQGFLKALHRSMGKTFDDPARTADLFTKTVKYTDYTEGPFKSNEDYRRYQEACLKMLHYYMTKGVGANYGLMNGHRWHAMVRSLKELGVLKTDIDADAVFTNELLKGVYGDGPAR